MSSKEQNRPVCLTIGGSDCSAGAGIQADLRTFHNLDCYGLSAVTSVVSEVPGHVAGWQEIKADLLKSQILLLSQHYPVSAVKIGLICSVEQVNAISSALRQWQQEQKTRPPIVLDPILAAGSGQSLQNYPDGVKEALVTELLPLVSLITPNIPEMDAFLNRNETVISDMDMQKQAAQQFSHDYDLAVLLKGGHLNSDPDKITNIYVNKKVTHEFNVNKVYKLNLHGTGCSLASAVTAGLASGNDLACSVKDGINYVQSLVNGAVSWDKPCSSSLANIDSTTRALAPSPNKSS